MKKTYVDNMFLIRIIKILLIIFIIYSCKKKDSPSSNSNNYSEYAVSIVTSSQSPFTCSLSNYGNVKCWGSNDYGQIGIGVIGGQYSTPQKVIGISNAKQLALGAAHVCAIITDLSVKCWGNNGQGELGNNSTTTSSDPVSVLGLTNAKMIVAGEMHTCVLLNDNTVKCWGSNSQGQLGNGSFTSSLIPVNVTGISNASLLFSGGVLPISDFYKA